MTSLFMEEQAHLALTVSRLQKAIDHHAKSLTRAQGNLTEANTYFLEELGAAHGDFLQAVEFSQNIAIEKQVLHAIDDAHKYIKRYTGLLNKPYFASIHYKENGEEAYETLYIGYQSFMDETSHDIYIYDWRTPIASVFYDFELGDVRYQAPDGHIFGHVDDKRQFDIQKGQLLQVYPTKMHIKDLRLISALSEQTTGHMKQIVETIQAEQNRIIREKKAPVLFVQGVAGSGKTVVALHRIAYLMYHGLKNSLKARDVLILSPSDVFSDYISRVIPELGEDPITSKTLVELTDDHTFGNLVDRHPYEDLETAFITGDTRFLDDDNLKHTQDFYLALMAHLSNLPHTLNYQTCYYGDKVMITGSQLKKAVTDNPKGRPLKDHFDLIAQRIKSNTRRYAPDFTKKLTFDTLMAGDHPFDYKAVVRLKRYKAFRDMSRQLAAIIDFSPLEVYKDFLSTCLKAPHLVGFKDMAKRTLDHMNQGTYSRTDRVVLSLISLLTGHTGPNATIKQVVVDESQDYLLLDYHLLKSLYPSAHFTVLGDYNQTLFTDKNQNHHQVISQVFNPADSKFMTLGTAYRNSGGIANLCLHLLGDDQAFNQINRPGPKPYLHQHTHAGQVKGLVDQLISEGHSRIALMTKTMAKARDWHAHLDKAVDLLDLYSLRLPEAAVITPIYLAKGMEFDAVILLDADSKTYTSLTDKQHLYVACSRALHELHIVYEGDLTPFLKSYFDKENTLV